eukprot:EG_transcript_8005
MGGPKWVKPQHGPRLEHQKKQRSRPEQRKKLSKALGLPQFGQFEPERFKRRRLGTAPVVTGGPPGTAAVAALKLAAARAEEDFQRKQELMGPAEEAKGGKARSKDGTYRAYYKEFRKVVEASDVLLEVLDARDPLGCRCPDIEKSIASEFNETKRVLLVLNKVDLIPREVAEHWLAELREDLPVVAFTSMKGAITNKCIDCVHRLLNAYSRTEDGGKRRITVGVIGYPNVGKSSVINALKREVVVAVGNTPGFTKCSTEVQLNSSVTIMDCPGIVFSSSAADSTASVLRNAIKVETIEDPIAPVELILERCDKAKLQEVYGLPGFTDATDFLTKIALKKGKVGKRCEPMLEDAARVVLKDWNDGAIPFYTLPVKSAGFSVNEATVPTEFQRQYESLVVQGLPSIEETRNCFLAGESARQVKYETAAVVPRKKQGKKRGREDDTASRVSYEDLDRDRDDEEEEDEEAHGDEENEDDDEDDEDAGDEGSNEGGDGMEEEEG